MLTIIEAIRMAQMFAEVAADASGVACMAMVGPCETGIRWAVVAAETGARIAAGEVAIALEEGEALPDVDNVRRIATGRN